MNAGTAMHTARVIAARAGITDLELQMSRVPEQKLLVMTLQGLLKQIVAVPYIEARNNFYRLLNMGRE